MLAFVLIETILQAGGLILASLQECHNTAIRYPRSYRIMCIGDSTTQRQYPALLEEVLNKSTTGIRFQVIDKGKVACNTFDILRRLETDLDQYHPDMVIAMMGINDHGPHMNYKKVSGSKVEAFLIHSRCYQLLKLLYFHIMARTNEARQDHVAPPLLDGLPDYKNMAAPADAPIVWKRYASQSMDSLCRALSKQEKYAQADRCLKKSIEFHPRDANAYVTLAHSYITCVFISHSGYETNLAINALRKAIRLTPDDIKALTDLGYFYRYLGLPERALPLFARAREIDSAFITPLSMEMDWRRNHYREAIRVLEYNLKYYPGRVKIFSIVAALYKEMGDDAMYRAYSEKARQASLEGTDSITLKNYNAVRNILLARKITFVCVQYPLRRVETLKKMLGDPTGLTFVDNEQSFKKAVARDGYERIFVDRFAGDFGHCTRQGNQLLAENIARAVLNLYPSPPSDVPQNAGRQNHP